MNENLCIYHGNCADGFAAAWVFSRYFDKPCDFHAGVYQKPPPALDGYETIYLLDFSYKRHVVQEMLEAGVKVVLIDHHKSALDDLQPLLVSGDLQGHTSLEHSGAMLAWLYVHRSDPTMQARAPRILKHIEDRDLWRFKLPRTREIQAAVFSYEYEFEIWDKIMDTDPDKLADDGVVLERKHHKDVRELLRTTQRMLMIEGHFVPVANIPYTMASDAGSIMAQGYAFAACYWDTQDGRQFSLRSLPDGIDVQEIAKKFGGGGHKHAAGFKVPFGHPLASA